MCQDALGQRGIAVDAPVMRAVILDTGRGAFDDESADALGACSAKWSATRPPIEAAEDAGRVQLQGVQHRRQVARAPVQRVPTSVVGRRRPAVADQVD